MKDWLGREGDNRGAKICPVETDDWPSNEGGITVTIPVSSQSSRQPVVNSSKEPKLARTS